MRILFVTRPIVPPWNEGSKNLTLNLASSLKRHTAHLLTTRVNSSHLLPHVKWHGIYRHNDLTLSQKFLLLKYLMFKPPVDIFHFFFVPTKLSSCIFSSLIRYYGKKSVQTLPCLPAGISSPEKIRKLIFADKVVVYSKYTHDKLLNCGLSNVAHINIGLDIKRFAEAKPDFHLRQRFGLKDDDVIILFAGEYSRLAGIPLLRRSILELTKNNLRCHFLIAGRILVPGDLSVEENFKKFVQKQKISNQVHFLGEVSDFAALLKTSNILFYPVKNMEGKIDTPLVILEAMASGLPVVTNDLPPLNEIFGSTNRSCLVDDDTLIERLFVLVGDQTLRKYEGDLMQSIVKKNYNLSKMIESYEEIYERLS